MFVLVFDCFGRRLFVFRCAARENGRSAFRLADRESLRVPVVRFSDTGSLKFVSAARTLFGRIAPAFNIDLDVRRAAAAAAASAV